MLSPFCFEGERFYNIENGPSQSRIKRENGLALSRIEVARAVGFITHRLGGKAHFFRWPITY